MSDIDNPFGCWPPKCNCGPAIDTNLQNKTTLGRIYLRAVSSSFKTGPVDQVLFLFLLPVQRESAPDAPHGFFEGGCDDPFDAGCEFLAGSSADLVEESMQREPAADAPRDFFEGGCDDTFHGGSEFLADSSADPVDESLRRESAADAPRDFFEGGCDDPFDGGCEFWAGSSADPLDGSLRRESAADT